MSTQTDRLPRHGGAAYRTELGDWAYVHLVLESMDWPDWGWWLGADFQRRVTLDEGCRHAEQLRKGVGS